MVIGELFAWAHVPKTGGDLVLALFEAIVPDLIVEADPSDRRDKHDGFAQRGPEVSSKPILAAGIRRLPNQQLSGAYHRYRYGDGRRGYKPLPMASPEEVASSDRGDRSLRRICMVEGRRVDHWIRMEHLREDFVAFVSRLRPLSEDEISRVATVYPGKGIPDYDHDPTHFFTREQIERLYENNPIWASVELEVYGDLAIPDEAHGRAPKDPEPWWEPFVHPGRGWRGGGRRSGPGDGRGVDRPT